MAAIDQMFAPKKFKAETSFSMTKPLSYIFWKTDDQPGGVPTWDEPGVQDRVREAWKLIKAHELAQKDGEALKDEASAAKAGAGTSLKKLAAKKKQITVMEPPKFTWLSSPLPGMAPTLSEVGDLQHIGTDFMQKVFSLAQDQVAVATNVPKSEVYVVRVVALTPFKDLWEKFISDETAQDYQVVMLQAIRGEVDSAWRAQVLNDAGFKDERSELRKAAERPSAPPPDLPEGVPTPEDL